MKNKIMNKLDLYGSIDIKVYSQFDPECCIYEGYNVTDVNDAIDIAQYYCNDIVYFNAPK